MKNKGLYALYLASTYSGAKFFYAYAATVQPKDSAAYYGLAFVFLFLFFLTIVNIASLLREK